jgi:hypothetical protein
MIDGWQAYTVQPNGIGAATTLQHPGESRRRPEHFARPPGEFRSRSGRPKMADLGNQAEMDSRFIRSDQQPGTPNR